jgi:hypothetical protein
LVYVEAVTPGDVVDDVKGTCAVSVTAIPDWRLPDTCIVPALRGVKTIVASPLMSVFPLLGLVGTTVVVPTFTVRGVKASNPVANTTTGVVPTGPLLG